MFNKLCLSQIAPFMKFNEVQQLIGLITAMAGLVILIAKYRKDITRPLKIWWFWHTAGYRTMLSVEQSFGIEAGKKIKTMFYDLNNRYDISSTRLDLLENTVSLGIYICDATGKFNYANNTIADIFGMDKSEMIGSGWLRNVKHREDVFKEWRFSVENKIPYRAEYELLNGKQVSTEAYPSLQDGVVVSWVGLLKLK